MMPSENCRLEYFVFALSATVSDRMRHSAQLFVRGREERKQNWIAFSLFKNHFDVKNNVLVVVRIVNEDESTICVEKKKKIVRERERERCIFLSLSVYSIPVLDVQHRHEVTQP